MFTPATAQISTFSFQNNLNTTCLYFRIHTREDRAVGIVRGQRALLSDDATDLGPQQAEHIPGGAAESLVQHRSVRHSQSITGRYTGPKDWPQSCSYFVADQCDITYTMYIYRDIILINFSDASWRSFCKKIWFTFHFSFFFKHKQHVCARVLGFPLPCIVLRTLNIYYEWESFAKYCSFFIFVCTARILLFLLLFIYWKWRIKFVFYLHWLSCVLLLHLRFWHS